MDEIYHLSPIPRVSATVWHLDAGLMWIWKRQERTERAAVVSNLAPVAIIGR